MFGDDLVRHYPAAWWFWIVFAVVVGGQLAGNTARLRSGATGWSLAGDWLFLTLNLYLFLGCGWIALRKFRARHANHAPLR